MSGVVEDSPRLIVNVEGHRVDAGILQGGRILASRSARENPVEALAPVLRGVLVESSLRPADLTNWIYSGGPGSLLGLRSLAMLLATWEVANHPSSISKYRFSGMVWTAREIQRQRPGEPFLLVSPWRTNAWNILSVGREPATESGLEVFEGTPSTPNEMPLYVLGGRLRSASPPGSHSVELPPFGTLPQHLNTSSFLFPTEGIEPLQSGTTEYRKWNPAPLSS